MGAGLLIKLVLDPPSLLGLRVPLIIKVYIKSPCPL